MSRLHIFDAFVETAERWMAELREELALAPEDHAATLRALHAGLHAIRDRLPAEEVLDLGAQLPTLIRGLYYDGWTGRHAPRQLRDRAAMIARVERELAPDVRLDPRDVLRAVMRMLVNHVSGGEIQHMLATLPRPIAAMWYELVGHAIEVPARPSGQREGHTGFAR